MKIAIEAAETAAVPLKEVVSGYRSVHMEDSHDVKLQADLESEKRIRSFLRAHAPYPIIGEEEGGDPDLLDRKDPYWVVDPLDGTFNYQRSIPHCCVSIALMQGRQSLVGAVLDFNRNELFTGGE
ncbi:MAG TPA: inositol monophosphatase family protein, partial [Opitutales bacterium]|nr:inositol monophosphatase family protein [Opitutales bacterium]